MFAVALATMLAAPLARAQERDNAAVGKITLLNRKAVEAYQQLEFEAAMRILNEALDQSERAGLTQHPIRARTLMTLGIVSLGGFRQRDQAVKYFRKALQIQPEVRLSPGLANPQIQAAFDEAIATLGSGVDLPPEKALVHEPVRIGQTVKPVPITVTPDKDLEASTVVLRYRAPNTYTFTDVPMQKSASGAFAASIPASATGGEQVLYFIEARRANGTVIVARGSAAEPLVVALASPASATPTTTAIATATAGSARSVSDKRLFFALLGGAGLGWVSGTGEETRNDVASSGVDWTPTGQLAPELGYFVTPRFMLGVQGRLQLVRGATPYHVPNPDIGECGDDNICAPAKGALAALAKATWFLADAGSAFQPYLSLSAGGGTIRHVSKVSGAATCGSGTEVCKDTVAGGPALFGPGVGFRYGVSDAVGIVAEIGALVGVPNFTANADLNIGVAFQL
jgi:tetratricopeptide (TPR) repeat protein